MKKLLTLCVVHQDSRILLGMKKRGFGEGRWNGFGGKVHDGETLDAAARRELTEEAGIIAQDMEKAGILTFIFKEKEEEPLEAHIFSASTFEGEPYETEEMAPRWFPVDEIPYHAMWPADQYWLPLLLHGKRFTGTIIFEGFDRVIKQDIREVAEV